MLIEGLGLRSVPLSGDKELGAKILKYSKSDVTQLGHLLLKTSSRILCKSFVDTKLNQESV
jgi:uncharacterized protein YprB with RNaseH-like and TPR domain